VCSLWKQLLLKQTSSRLDVGMDVGRRSMMHHNLTTVIPAVGFSNDGWP
jgi:hypothetical protein